MSSGDNCTTGCRTRDHESYAQCLRAKSTRVAYCNSAGGFDATAQKQWDRDLAAYQDARSQGIQPSGTSRQQVENAVALSNEVGKAWDAS